MDAREELQILRDRAELARLRALEEESKKNIKQEVQNDPGYEYWRQIPLQIGEGMTFGHMGELEALARASTDYATNGSMPFGEAYDYYKKAAEKKQDAFYNDNPGLAFSTELTGGLLQGNKLAAGLKGTAFTRGAKLGGIEGGLFGAGKSRESVFENPVGFLGDALQGSGTGAMFGGIMTPVIERAVPLVANYSGKLWRALTETPDVRAARGLKNDILYDFGDDVDAAVGKYARYGDKGMPMDISESVKGNTVEGLLHANNRRADLASYVNQRGREQEQRIGGLLEQNTGFNVPSGRLMIKEVQEEAANKAAPLYESAHAKRIIFDDKPELAELLQRPSAQQALRKARKNALDDGMNPDDLFDETSMSLKYLDYAKQELDDMIEPAIRSGEHGMARRLTKLKNDILKLIDNDPDYADYKQARNVWAGKKEIEDAYTYGKDILKPKTDVFGLDDVIDGYTESEKRAFRAGAFETLIRKVEEKGYTQNVMQIFDKPIMMRRLKAVFQSDKAIDDFLQAAQRESDFNRTKAIVDVNVRSPTKLYDGGNLSEAVKPSQIKESVDPLNIAAKAGSAMFKNSRADRETAEAYIKMASDYNMTPEELRRFLTVIDRQANLVDWNFSPAQRNAVNAAIGVSGGLLGAGQ